MSIHKNKSNVICGLSWESVRKKLLENLEKNNKTRSQNKIDNLKQHNEFQQMNDEPLLQKK